MSQRATECSRKVRHATKVAAEKAIESLQADGKDRDGFRLNVYPCFWCKGWHVGNRPVYKKRK